MHMQVSFKRHNGNVHRAAAKIIVSKSRAARGSVCNVLLSRAFAIKIVVKQFYIIGIVLGSFQKIMIKQFV